MCGLIHIKRLDGLDARKSALARYADQKTRGQDGFGFIALKEGNILAYERAETEEEIKEKLDKVPCDEVLLHHRYPTSTPNFAEAAHPLKVSHKMLEHDYFFIHNGIIKDDEVWKKMHEEDGFIYTTEMSTGWLVGGILRNREIQWNDSEALAIELALDLDAKGSGVLVDGSIAFIGIQVSKKTGKPLRLFYGRDSVMPLKLYELPKTFMALTSEGHGPSIKEHTLFTYDYETGKTTERPYKVGADSLRDRNVPDYGKTYGEPDEESEMQVIEFGGKEPLEHPDEYYILDNELTAIEDKIAFWEESGYDTVELEDEKTRIMDRLEELEAEYDAAEVIETNKTLISN